MFDRITLVCWKGDDRTKQIHMESNDEQTRYKTVPGGETSVLELWDVWIASSLWLFSGSLWPGMRLLVMVAYLAQIDLLQIICIR